MLRIGIIGLGYWGPNLLRCFSRFTDCQVVVVCDRDASRLAEVQRQFPGIRGTEQVDDVLNPNDVDAVVIATPTETHFALAHRALQLGLHAFVEKPLATLTDECHSLTTLAAAKNRVLFVGHVFLYSAPVQKLRELVFDDALGELCYICSRRLNLGPVRRDVNAMWDLAPHDISIILELMDTTPKSVSCSGLAYLREGVHDVCNLSIHFHDNRIGIIHVSWLDPHKKREMTVVGSKKMAVYDDIDPLEKIKVYDIGVDAPAYVSSFGEFAYSYRYGDTFSPRLNEEEPLKLECRAFVDAIVKNAPCRTDGKNGEDVVRVLEAADRSLHNGGGHVSLFPNTSMNSRAARSGSTE